MFSFSTTNYLTEINHNPIQKVYPLTNFNNILRENPMSQPNSYNSHFIDPISPNFQGQLYSFAPFNLSNVPESEEKIFSREVEQDMQVFRNIRELISQLCTQKTEKNQKQSQEASFKQLEHAKNITSLNHELNYYKEVASSHERKLKLTEENLEKTVKENANKHRKQVKKYIQLYNEKENQCQNLQKTIKNLNSRIQNLTTQIDTLNQTRLNLQNTVIKSIESVKTNFKQFDYILQENQLDRVALEGKYKQLCDKIEQVIKQCQESEHQKNRVEKKYEKLKETYETSRNQCIELKFQVERYRIKVKDYIERENKVRQETKSHENTDKQQLKQITMGELKEMTMGIMKNLKSIQQNSQKFAEIEAANKQIKELINQNQNLKLDLQQKQIRLDQLELLVQGPVYEDEMLKARNPSLYQQLLRHKQRISQFEFKVQEIVERAVKTEEILRQKGESRNDQTHEIHENVNKTKSKKRPSKEQFIQELQAAKQKALAKERENFDKLRQKDTKRIKQLQAKVASLQQENQQLRSQVQSYESQKQKHRVLLQQLAQQNMKKKKQGKTKGKVKCQLCATDLGQIKNKCSECLGKFHSECIKYHICTNKINEEINQDSQYTEP